MRRRSASGAGRVLILSCLALGSASGAATGARRSPSPGKPPVTCGARPGTTVLEDAAVRVLSHRRRLFACTRPSGRLRSLPPSAEGLLLSGRYVAYTTFGGPPLSLVLHVLDVRRGTTRRVGFVAGQEGHYATQVLGDYVLNSHGTVVWIRQDAACPYPGDCYARGTVLESADRADRILESTTNSGPGAGTPSGSLGLSLGGTIAYWTTNGSPRSAAIR